MGSVVSVKEQMSNIIQDQPEDSSYEEILRELAFALMIDRGMASINWTAEGEWRPSVVCAGIYS